MNKEPVTKRSLGLLMLTALVAGNMIGSGVFLLPASLATIGTIGIVAWVLTSIGAIVLALIFANLSRMMPRTGGQYTYCREAYGDFVGFQIGYNYWVAVCVGNAAIVVAFVGYLSVFWPALNYTPWLSLAVSLATLWFLTLVNIIGVRQAGQLQVLTTVLKLIPLLLIGTVGLFFIHKHNLAQFNISGKSNMSALTMAATLTLWSFIGFESATVPADDVSNPKRTIPIATILGTVIAALVYIFSTIGVMGMVPLSQLANSSSPYALAADHLLGSWGGLLIAAAAMIACFGTLNGWTLLAGQIPLAAARDDLFPKPFARLTSRGTPAVSLVVSSILVSILLMMRYGASLVDQFTFIILLATLASLIPYLFTSVAELILLMREPQKVNPARLKKSLILAIIGFLFTFWAIAGAGQDIVFYGLLLLLTSVPIYVWLMWRRHRELVTN